MPLQTRYQSADSRPCRKDRSRVDLSGRAYAGSQRQIQTYVNDGAVALSEAVRTHFGLRDGVGIRWVSPLRNEGYTEYRDVDFLRALGLGHLASKLRAFWPFGGPCWDALARIELNQSEGVVLVEAKSHVSEIYGNCCGAAGDSLKQIQSSLNRAKSWLGVDPTADWTGRLYQSANRYAHLYFLREITGVEAHLANVYFVGDPHSPTTVEEWRTGIRLVEEELKVVVPVPFTAAVFLQSLD